MFTPKRSAERSLLRPPRRRFFSPETYAGVRRLDRQQLRRDHCRRRMKIYTKTGDDGSTSLFGGPRVSKSDPRIDCYGNVDELNATIGWAAVVTVTETGKLLTIIQHE